jgi:hypothetical protein
MSEFEISELAFGSGIIGMSPLPGANDNYAKDMAVWMNWKPRCGFVHDGSGRNENAGLCRYSG